MNRYNISITSYRQLYDAVKEVRDKYNIVSDTSQMVDDLIYRWFSSAGVRALDSCYLKFNEILSKEGQIEISIEGGRIRAKWE
ncbi:MAG: hypothetical protein ACOCZR_02685 [Halanaerobiales bacterium]